MASLADEYHYGIDMNFIHWTYSAILQMVSLCGVYCGQRLRPRYTLGMEAHLHIYMMG